MEKINEIKLPEGVDRLSVKQYDDKIVFEFIPEKPKFKRGDILKSTITHGLTVIFDKMTSITAFTSIYNNGEAANHCWGLRFFRHATKEEKQEFFDELKADGKRWNAEKLEIENIPQPKFKIGDKVRIKDGISSKTHSHVYPYFTNTMDKFIGKELTVKENSCIERVEFNEDDHGFHFHENWLEPYAEDILKKGDLAIFWDSDYLNLSIRLYHGKSFRGNMHSDNLGVVWDNAVKWDGTKEQFEKVEKVLKGEID